MVGWNHWLNGHEFEQAWGVGDGRGSLACFSPLDRKESDMTERLSCLHLCHLRSLYIYIYHLYLNLYIYIYVCVLGKRKYCSSGDLKIHSRVVKQKILSAQDQCINGVFWNMDKLGFIYYMNLTLTSLLHRRRQWHPTPVLLPGKSYGWRSLVGYSPWGC